MAKKKTAKKKKRKLSGKQERFCKEYIIDHNGGGAARRAGYAIKTSDSIAYENLRKPQILARIAELEKPIIEKCNVTAEKVVQKLADIAFFDPLDLFKEDGSLKELSDMPKSARCVISGIEVMEELGEKNGRKSVVVGYTKKIKLSPAIKALELLGKTTTLSLFAENVNVNNGNAPISKEDLKLAGKDLAKDIAAEIEKHNK